jgi:hypothetical protein
VERNKQNGPKIRMRLVSAESDLSTHGQSAALRVNFELDSVTGILKCVGRIYQQTSIDTYSKVAMVELYDRKNAVVAAKLLNDRVAPFFDANEIPLLRSVGACVTPFTDSHPAYQRRQ